MDTTKANANHKAKIHFNILKHQKQTNKQNKNKKKHRRVIKSSWLSNLCLHSQFRLIISMIKHHKQKGLWFIPAKFDPSEITARVKDLTRYNEREKIEKE